MRALVVFESMFGNTEEVARAVADGLAARLEVDVVPVEDAPAAVTGPVLLVVGGPTHAMGMSRTGTREDAARQATTTTTSTTTGLREWLGGLASLPDVVATTFDTRVHAPVPGSAARAAARRLRRLGAQVVAPPTTFWVAGTPGPLVEGELDRARRWGAELAAAVPQPA